jgi:hypothetical protein
MDVRFCLLYKSYSGYMSQHVPTLYKAMRTCKHARTCPNIVQPHMSKYCTTAHVQILYKAMRTCKHVHTMYKANMSKANMSKYCTKQTCKHVQIVYKAMRTCKHARTCPNIVQPHMSKHCTCPNIVQPHMSKYCTTAHVQILYKAMCTCKHARTGLAGPNVNF